MDDAVEKMAEAICKTNPVTINGRSIEWDELSEFHPDRAVEYREAAANRIRAEEAMRLLNKRPVATLVTDPQLVAGTKVGTGPR